ncbi:MAG: hypothetical protein GY749_05365, partial [Desulfobacteraceae bacterium]|nr:hypothetical protein [Desulfobacteraceae bacterium]
KTAAYLQRFPGKKILPAFLSVGGFTKGAAKFCKEKDIGVAEQIAFFQEDKQDREHSEKAGCQ